MQRYFILLLIVFITSSCQADKKKQANIDLINAAKEGNFIGVQNAMNAGADVNFQDENGNTAIMIALNNKHSDVVSELYNRFDASADITNKKGLSVKELVKTGNDFYLKDLFFPKVLTKYEKELIEISMKGDLVQFREITKNKDVDINAYDGYKITALMHAAQGGYIDLVKEILKFHPDLNITSSDDDWTAVFLAASDGHWEIVKLLIEAGADITKKPFEEYTILAEAARKGSIEMMQYVLDKGEDINELCFYDENALFYAIRGKQLEAVKFLVNKGIEYNITNYEGMTPLSLAKEENNTNIADYLKSKGAK